MNPRVLMPLLVGSGLVIVAAVGRVAPHPPNFVPIAAAALFAGFFFKNRVIALAIPLASLAMSDLAIGGYDWRIMCVVYAALAWPVALRTLVRRFSVRRIVGCSLASSAVFYLVSNVAVWAFSPMYPVTFAGLTACYVAALPFLAFTVAGDLFWCGVFFGGYALCKSQLGLRVRWLDTAGWSSQGTTSA
jgi:hypothetical protein